MHNFKLLRDIDIQLSIDPAKPLTVIRAENASGKTSLHYAIIWGLYGMDALKNIASPRDIRFSSKAAPAGSPVLIEVVLDFQITDEAGTADYRLTRHVQETPQATGPVDRGREVVKLSKLTAAGDKELDQPESWLDQWLPKRLVDIFFTNGDDVQKFITGKQEARLRQEKVHLAIESLLGIRQLRTAVVDIEAVQRTLDRKAARDAGGKLERVTSELEKLELALKEIDDEYERLTVRLGNIEKNQSRKTRELESIRGIGELDAINQEIQGLEQDLASLEGYRRKNLATMTGLLRSEALSWTLACGPLTMALARLDKLTDLRKIPKTSTQILEDRLELGVCICGETLDPGSTHRDEVAKLLAEQQGRDPIADRLTDLRYRAKALRSVNQQDFTEAHAEALGDFAKLADSIRSKTTALQAAKERRALIDEERVRELTEELAELDRKKGDVNFKLGTLDTRRVTVQYDCDQKREEKRNAERNANISRDLAVRRDVGLDLLSLARAVQEQLEGPYVQRVSNRLDRMFKDIIGADNGDTTGVITSTSITSSFDIVVSSQHDNKLDPDFEVNGASQRALTLAFVWSLMEVAGTVAPRFIDTPLGMVSGTTKERMVEAITRPPAPDETPYQVVLLLTRSELAGVEHILDERAGAFNTLSSSQHYPLDLVYKWAEDEPHSRSCGCSHREQCKICARRQDNDLGLRFREESVV
ncbi:AAA family ATPase [Streptantibioticus ferralitis]|uniref:AAA family ATPase n=1 Tax=Streptantibioticus ferralitis TaxID=236510 RepID=A0ABT5YS86_9ACTN|nr:AAA family ATPase [Streptantibioticus ferralitis]MDF2254313.1 AAA family ATPase [Streptantibioticus ferralitis]